MKLIIAGSRNIKDSKVVGEALQEFNITPRMVQEIVSGTAKGVDQLGEQLALRNNIPIKKFPADWDQYGKSAGYRRNAEMAKYADVLLAIWDGKSKGTKHMIDLMEKENKPVYVYSIS